MRCDRGGEDGGDGGDGGDSGSVCGMKERENEVGRDAKLFLIALPGPRQALVRNEINLGFGP